MATDSTVAAPAAATDGPAPSSAPSTSSTTGTPAPSGGQPADLTGQAGNPLADIIGKPSANEDAVLAALGITRDDEAPAQPKAEPEPTAEDATEPEGEQAPAESEPEPDAFAKAAAEQERRETVVLARRLAGRMKIPANIIAKMSEDELVAWYPDAAKRQKAVDQAFNDLKRLKTAPNQTTDPDADTGDEVDDDTPDERFAGLTNPKGSPSPYPGNKAAPDLDRFIAEQALDTESAAKLRAMFAQTTKSATKAIEAERASLTQGLQAIAAERMTTARMNTMQEWPGLKDPQQFTRVVQWMQKHDPDGAVLYGTPDAFRDHFRDACTVVFGPAARAQAQQAMLRKGRETLDSQPERPSTKAPVTRDAALTPDDFDRLAFQAAAEAGGTAKFGQIAAKLPPNPRRA